MLHVTGVAGVHRAERVELNHGGQGSVEGNDAWWAGETQLGSVTNPAGDVPVPAPDGPAIDIVEVRAFQVADSELVQVEVEFARSGRAGEADYTAAPKTDAQGAGTAKG